MRRELWRPPSFGSLLLGALLFAASLTPSLLPRTYLTQGVVSGLSLSVGYGIGKCGSWLWAYMEFSKPKRDILHAIRCASATGTAVITVFSLVLATGWQNSIRELMQLAPIYTVYPIQVAVIALVVFAILLAVARLLRLTFRLMAIRVKRFLPGQVANVFAVIAAIAVFWLVIHGILIRVALGLADASYKELDKLIEPETEQPTDGLKTGSNASLLAWKEIGRAGREFVSSGPSREDISAISGREALEPLRVYVGLRSAGTPEARAKLALEELKRVDGFKRSVLIVITPTGTGWVDPAALDSVEYLHGGAVASVALQYSYLGSWLYLLAGADYGGDAARALFKEIYGYWTTLPEDSRPRLYLHGLSLGAKNSEQSTDLIEVLSDPFSGALWSGPPYSSRLWRFLTDHRNLGSPAWLPWYRDGSFVRFMNQDGEATGPASFPNAAWGPMRIVYLQYASDPVTFFEYRSLYREPDWMDEPRGPDVSTRLRWYPIVTLIQLTADKLMALSAPPGHGHFYAPEHYINAWIEVTDVRGWSTAEIMRLKKHLSKR